MKIHEDLVYDKTGVYMHGFVNLGDINQKLLKLEQEIDGGEANVQLATHTCMLTLMVRGIFIKLEYPYASFPTTGIVKKAYMNCTHNVNVHAGVTSEYLYWIMWEAVRRLEESGLKVLLIIFTLTL